jgi:hypothetical protein
MGKTICEITNDLLTEGLFAVCPSCGFYDVTIKNDGTLNRVCAVQYPHEGLPCWNIFLEYSKTGKSFYVPVELWGKGYGEEK